MAHLFKQIADMQASTDARSCPVQQSGPARLYFRLPQGAKSQDTCIVRIETLPQLPEGQRGLWTWEGRVDASRDTRTKSRRPAGEPRMARRILQGEKRIIKAVLKTVL